MIIDTGEPPIRLDAIAAKLDASLVAVRGTTRSSVEHEVRGTVARPLPGSACRAVLVMPSLRHA